MNSPPEPVPLRELQARCAAALLAPRDDSDDCVAFARALVDDGLPALARIRVYRNNTRLVFGDALGRTYTVVRRRVGAPFFDQLAREFRDAHPSTRGDLHWIGEPFPAWLATRLRDTDYEWLADLARLEWACAASLVSRDTAAVAVSELGRVRTDRLAAARLELQPSLRLVSSAWPIWSVWKENRPEAEGRAVDLSLGAEHVLVACTEAGLVLLSVPEDEFRFAAELAAGRSLAAAVERADLPVERLPAALGRLFAERLVVAVQVPTAEAAP